MNIAIVGAGFAGIATAWHLLQNPGVQVTVFDPNDIGGGASGMAAGLLHPFPGPHSKLSRFGREGWDATSKLLSIASQNVQIPLADYSGLVRSAITAEQKTDFFAQSQRHHDIRWLSAQECQTLVPGITDEPGIFIDSHACVNCELYLQGLWSACLKLGACLKNIAIHSLAELDSFDAVIVTMGSFCQTLPDLKSLPISFIKGQTVELEWPNSRPRLPYSLNSQAYIVMNSLKLSCHVGATFERDYKTAEPVPEIAIAELLPKAKAIFPGVEKFPLISCKAGIRVSTPDHLPLIKQVNKNSWVFVGLGSKGLLYHAFFAEMLSKKVYHCILNYPKKIS